MKRTIAIVAGGKMDALSLQCLSADSYMVMPRGGNVQ